MTSGRPPSRRVGLRGRITLVFVLLTVLVVGTTDLLAWAVMPGPERGLLPGVLLVALVLPVVAAVAVGWLAGRVAVRPLRELVRLTDAAARGEPGVRLAGEGDPELERLSRSFNQTIDALERRVGADARFAADVSHELRTPLTTMLTSVQYIRNREAMLPVEVHEPLTILAEELERYRRLVVELIEMSRTDSSSRLRRERLRVAEVVTEAADAAAGRPLTTVEASAADQTIEADRSGIAAVVANLVENAERHGRGCVGVTARREGPRVRIEVDDAGPGVPESLRQRVFERFVRASGSGAEGNGLGLAIVARHVGDHGGTVVATPRPGGGSRFIVELPLAGR